MRTKRGGREDLLSGQWSAFLLTATMLFVVFTLREARAIGWYYPDLDVSQIYTHAIYLNPGEGVLCWTSNSSPGADPAMHLTKVFTWEEVAFGNDMSSSPDVLLAYTEPSTTSGGYYQVVIRSDESPVGNVAPQGKTDLSCWFTSDGRIVDKDDVPVGGFLATTMVDPGGVFETAQRPGGPTTTRLIRMTTDRHVIDSDSHGGVGTMSRIEPDVSQFEVYTTVVAVDHNRSLGPYTQTEGHVQFYGNDLGLNGNNDHDGDGLGAELEDLLMTCDSTTTHPYCSTIPNLLDSDGDGLRDDWEVFGEDRVFPTPDNYFPYWGANPAQKDVFVEVDYVGIDDRTDEDDAFTGNPYALLSEDERQDWFDVMALPYSLGSSADVRNGNGSRGINVHVDTGVNPDPSHSDAWEYAGKFGDWGGAGDPVRYEDVDEGEWNYVNAYENTNYFDEGRYGRFHYAVTYNGGGGQAIIDFPPAFHFGELTSNPAGDGAANFAHELGHSLSLRHNFDAKEPNCNPIYLSLMNYRYSLRLPLRFSSSDDATATMVNPSALREYDSLGFGNLPSDPEHTNRPLELLLRAPYSATGAPMDGGSVPYTVRYFDGEYSTNPPVSVPQFQIVYPYSGLSVDWNQDGVLGGGSPSNDPPVRSMMRMPTNDCGDGLAAEKVSRYVSSQTTPSSSTPQLVYTGGFMYSTYVVAGQVRSRAALIPGLGSASCTEGDSLGSSCHQLYSEQSFASPFPQDAVHQRVTRLVTPADNGDGDLLFSITRQNGDLVLCRAHGGGYPYYPLYIDGCSQPLGNNVTASEIGYIYERVAGVNEKRLAVFGTFEGGVLAYKTLQGPDPLDLSDWSNGRLVTDGTTASSIVISGSDTAISVAAWPPIDDLSAAATDSSTCFAMRELTDDVAVYCTDLAQSDLVWKRVANGVGSTINGEKTVGEPWLEFTRERLATGARRWADPRVGRFVLTYTELDSASQPQGERDGVYRRSDLMGPRLNSNLLAFTPSGTNAWRFDFGLEFGAVDRTTAGVSVLDSSHIGATKALLYRPQEDPTYPAEPRTVRLQWAFDGALDDDYESHNDFVRMAERMCDELGHPSDDDFVCE